MEDRRYREDLLDDRIRESKAFNAQAFRIFKGDLPCCPDWDTLQDCHWSGNAICDDCETCSSEDFVSELLVGKDPEIKP